MSYIMDSIRAQGYDGFSHDRKDCICGGCGWWLTNWDTWQECPTHSAGMPFPENHCETCLHRHDGDGFECFRPRGYLICPVPSKDHPAMKRFHCAEWGVYHHWAREAGEKEPTAWETFIGPWEHGYDAYDNRWYPIWPASYDDTDIPF